jgi:hypothetical protein
VQATPVPQTSKSIAQRKQNVDNATTSATTLVTAEQQARRLQTALRSLLDKASAQLERLRGRIAP